MIRTGKSFFLNQLTRTAQRVEQLAPSDNNVSSLTSTSASPKAQVSGFCVGPTTESCTRGIWLWDPQPSVRNARGEKVLFMDTEGIAATDNDESYDAKIFSLGLLLSSLFVFNTMGVIDEGAIDRLFLVSELTKHVCVSTGDATADRLKTQQQLAANPQTSVDPDDAASASLDAESNELKDALAESRDLAPHFPPFIWLLRDFMLDMAHDGTALSPNEYLEQALAPRDSSSSRRNDERNKIRQSIQILFATRECLTLVRPVMDEQQLRRAAELSPDELRPEFVEQMAMIRQRILSVVKPKQLFGRAMDGRQLAHLVTCYTQTMTSGAVPDIRAAWEYVSEATCQTALAQAIDVYDARIATTNAEPSGDAASVVILSQQAFEKIHKDAQDEALSVFKQTSVDGPSRATCFQRLKTHIQKEKTAHVALLQTRSTAHCERVLVRLQQLHLHEPLARGDWDLLLVADAQKPGDSRSSDGSRSLTQTLDTLESEYDALAQGPSAKRVFYDFLRRDAVAFAHALVLRLRDAHAAAHAAHSQELTALRHSHEVETLHWQQEHQSHASECARLNNANAHAAEKLALQSERIAALQSQSTEQQDALTVLEDKKQQLGTELAALATSQQALERSVATLETSLAHKDATLQEHQKRAEATKRELSDALESLRQSHEREREAWITKSAEQSADKNALRKQLAAREHELQQQTRDLELAHKQRSQLERALASETEALAARTADWRDAQQQTAALETQLEDTLTCQSSLSEDAERERAKLQRRVERYELQLGRLEAEREVSDVVRECVAEVARLAEVERVHVVEEEKALLQTQLSDLYLKVSTLPDFYQREIFCSPDPTPDFFDALTA